MSGERVFRRWRHAYILEGEIVRIGEYRRKERKDEHHIWLILGIINGRWLVHDEKWMMYTPYKHTVLLGLCDYRYGMDQTHP